MGLSSSTAWHWQLTCSPQRKGKLSDEKISASRLIAQSESLQTHSVILAPVANLGPNCLSCLTHPVGRVEGYISTASFGRCHLSSSFPPFRTYLVRRTCTSSCNLLGLLDFLIILRDPSSTGLHLATVMSPTAASNVAREDVQQTSQLTAAAVAHKIAETAPSQTNGPLPTTLAPLDASKLRFTRTTNPQTVPELDDPIVATTSACTDHMIACVWNSSTGWGVPELKPYGPLSIMPTASVLHYATECFEGMKVYRGHDGELRLFRPNKNCERMLISAARIALPAFDPKELEKLIVAMMAVDGAKWLPKSRAGNFLYLRPTMIGTAAQLGVQIPKEATLFVIATFMPSLSDPVLVPGVKPGMKLLASQNDTVRAWPGGFGFAKVGANYGPSLMAQQEARSRGYDQVLWLFGEERLVTEAGASNFFVVWRTKQGTLQLVTAPLGDKIILDGVTRRSILELARTRLADGRAGLEAIEVVERTYTMADVLEASEEGRLVEAFAAGTAVSGYRS